MTNSPSCASVVYQNKLEEIHKLCHIGFLELNSNNALVIYNLQNSSLLVINPTKKVYMPGALATVHIVMFLFLI